MEAIAYFPASKKSNSDDDSNCIIQKTVQFFADQERLKIKKNYCESSFDGKNEFHQFRSALIHCKDESAILIISELKNLKANPVFISILIKSGVNFIVPGHSEFHPDALLNLHAAALEQKTRISLKIRNSLKVLKERGVKLGVHGKKVLSKNNKVAACRFAKKLTPIITRFQADGFTTIRNLTAELNRQQIPTYSGGEKQWHLRSVNLLLKRIKRKGTREKPQPIKWVGGKRSILKSLKSHLPETFNNYYEPFLGGGALFFGLHAGLKKAYLSDTNKDLITMYKVIKSEPRRLINLLKTHSKSHDEEYYYEQRGKHELSDPIEIAARFLYLNKTCYNGLWRVNKKGEFNASIGNYSKPLICNAINILACSKALRFSSLQLKDYKKIKPKPGDFVYFDPPYDRTSATSFTSYSPTAFSKSDQIKLAKYCHRLSQQGVKIMVSNSNTNLVKELYALPEFNIHYIKAPRLISSNPDARRPVEELIITNYD